jgi:hypothetical protein
MRTGIDSNEMNGVVREGQAEISPKLVEDLVAQNAYRIRWDLRIDLLRGYRFADPRQTGPKQSQKLAVQNFPLVASESPPLHRRVVGHDAGLLGGVRSGR